MPMTINEYRVDGGAGYETPCHIFMGPVSEAGYGELPTAVAGTRYVHRVAWQQEHGPVPAGMHLDHKCRVRICRNVGHLEVVTPLENARRGQGNAGPRVVSEKVHTGRLVVGGVCWSGQHLIRQKDLRAGQCLACKYQVHRRNAVRFRNQSFAAQQGDWVEFRRLAERDVTQVLLLRQEATQRLRRRHEVSLGYGCCLGECYHQFDADELDTDFPVIDESGWDSTEMLAMEGWA